MTRPRVVVVGGGFSGATFAVHLLRAAQVPFEIVVIEPRPALGAGLAYGSAAPEHRINVPSDKMIVFGEDTTHLTRWLRAEGLFESDPEAVTPEGHHYARRGDFARYVAALLDEALQRAVPGSTLRHVRTTAIGIVRNASGVASDASDFARSRSGVAASGSGITPRAAAHRVELADGTALEGDAVVVTASHETPAFPWAADDSALRHAGMMRDPWTQLHGLDVASMDEDSTVVMAGTGLTMCDVVVSLCRRGFRGQVLAISRRALLPRTHAGFFDRFDLLAGNPVPTSARALLRRSREAVGRAADWRQAVDAVRFALPALWQALPPRERRRAVRWLKPFWDVHRFRMAPQVDAVVRTQIERGKVHVVSGRIAAIGSDAGNLVVDWRTRDGLRRQTRCAAFVNCTGPSSDPARMENPLIRSLLESELAVADAAGVGLECDADGRLRGQDGVLAQHLCVAGPLARAAIAEVTGVPEASAHTRRVAERLAADPALRRPAKASRATTKGSLP